MPSRYSDEQLYALALYVYALQPPPNPNQFDALAQRGQKVFQREGCAGCHTPPLYTNNKLTPAEGFTVPEDHPNKYDILPISVGTDSSLALRTRRGTGYYKVPSLRGLWYRGPFEHNGSVATLEDWFRDIRRLRVAHRNVGRDLAKAIKGAYLGQLDAPTLAKIDRDWGVLYANDASVLCGDRLCGGPLDFPAARSASRRPSQTVSVAGPSVERFRAWACVPVAPPFRSRTSFAFCLPEVLLPRFARCIIPVFLFLQPVLTSLSERQCSARRRQ